MTNALDPIDALLADRQAALDAQDPVAGLCWAASVEDGEPTVRTLVLRVLERDLALFIKSERPKWRAWLDGPVALTTFYPSQQVQYRVTATAEAIARETVADSWRQRPDTPKKLDALYATYPQSSGIADRQTLIEAVTETAVPESAPESVGGLRLSPFRVERLSLTADGTPHERVRYVLDGEAWAVETLVP